MEVICVCFESYSFWYMARKGISGNTGRLQKADNVSYALNSITVYLVSDGKSRWCSPPITVTSWYARWRLKLPSLELFTLPYIKAQTKENIKATRHWPLWGDFTATGEFHKGQWRGKCFHLMTSSWPTVVLVACEPQSSSIMLFTVDLWALMSGRCPCRTR